jgi:hypothetical protein
LSANSTGASPVEPGAAAPTIDKIWAAFAQVEVAEKLADWRIAGVYLWPILRDRLMREIAENLGLYERRPAVDRVHDIAEQRGLRVTEFVIKPSQYAVVPFLRRNASGIDPFSAGIVAALRDEQTGTAESAFGEVSLPPHGIEPLIFGMGADDLGSGRPQVELLEQQFLHAHNLQAKVAIAPFVLPQLGGAKHIAKYARVIKALESELAPEAPLVLSTESRLDQADSSQTPVSGSIVGRFRVFPRWLLVEFTAQRIGWKRLFKKAGVRKLFIVNAWKRALIAGAQDAGVWVVEPQHGLLSSKHPLLSWPGRQSVAYLPNELYVWGQCWAAETDLPSGLRATIVGEPAHLTAARAAASTAASSSGAASTTTETPSANVGPHRDFARAGSVLFVSQVQQTTRLFDIALRAAEANPSKNFVVKPHPQENAEQFRQHLRDLGRRLPANLRFVDLSEPALNLVARSEFVVGVHSMALVEALALGAKVIAVQLEGWQNIEAIAKRGDLTLASQNTDLVAELASAKVARDPEYYFAQQLEASAFGQLVRQERP